jgi:hypothetical protein
MLKFVISGCHFFASKFHFSYVIFFAGEMFDNIYYFLSHFNQIFILNFGLLKWVTECYISGTRFNIHSGQPKLLKLPVC